MEPIESKKRLVIIYHPNKEFAYSTVDLGDENYEIAESIVCEPGIVNVVVKEDSELVGKVYSGMPYYFEMW